MTFIQTRISAQSTVYGVVLNDKESLRTIGDLNAAPYKGAPQQPVMYIKPAGTRVAYGATVRLPQGATEVEIGVTVGLVLGRSVARLTPQNAMDTVTGLVLAADLSLPHDSYYRPAIREKCFDGALPIGDIKPLSDLSQMRLDVEIDDTLAGSWSLASLVRDPAQLLSDVSEYITLHAGDVLLVGVRFAAPRAALGSSVRVTGCGLDTLEFTIEGEPR